MSEKRQVAVQTVVDRNNGFQFLERLFHFVPLGMAVPLVTAGENRHFERSVSHFFAVVINGFAGVEQAVGHTSHRNGVAVAFVIFVVVFRGLPLINIERERPGIAAPDSGIPIEL